MSTAASDIKKKLADIKAAKEAAKAAAEAAKTAEIVEPVKEEKIQELEEKIQEIEEKMIEESPEETKIEEQISIEPSEFVSDEKLITSSDIDKEDIQLREKFIDSNCLYIDMNSGHNFQTDSIITTGEQFDEYGNNLQMYFDLIDKTKEPVDEASKNKLTSLTPILLQKMDNIIAYMLFMCLDQGHDFHAGGGRGASPGNWVSENYIMNTSRLNTINLTLSQNTQKIPYPCNTEFIQGLINTSFCGGKSVYGILVGNYDDLNFLETSTNYGLDNKLDIQKILDQQKISFTKESKGIMSIGDGSNAGLSIEITDCLSSAGETHSSIKLLFLPFNKYNYNAGMHRVWDFNKKTKIYSVRLDELTAELLEGKMIFKDPIYSCQELLSLNLIVPEYTLNFEYFLKKFEEGHGVSINQSNYIEYTYGTEKYKELFDSFVIELYSLDKFGITPKLFEQHDVASSPPNLPNIISPEQLEFIKSNVMVRGAKYKFYNITSDSKRNERKNKAEKYAVLNAQDAKEDIFLNLLRGLYSNLSPYIHDSYSTPDEEKNTILNQLREKYLGSSSETIIKQAGFVLDTSMSPVPGFVIQAVVGEYWRDPPVSLSTTVSEAGTDIESISNTTYESSQESISSLNSEGQTTQSVSRPNLNFEKPIKYFNHTWNKNILSSLNTSEDIFRFLPNGIDDVKIPESLEGISSNLSGQTASELELSPVSREEFVPYADLGGGKDDDDEEEEEGLEVVFPYKFQIVSGAIDSSKLGGQVLPDYYPPHIDIYMFIFDRDENNIRGVIVRLVFLKKINDNKLNKKSNVNVDNHFIYVDFDDITLSQELLDIPNWKSEPDSYKLAYGELLDYVVNNTELLDDQLYLTLKEDKGEKQWHKITYTDGGPTVGESIMNVTDKYESIQHFSNYLTGTNFSIGENIIHVAQKIYLDSEQIRGIYLPDSASELNPRNRLFEKLFLVRNKFFGDKSRSLDTLFINKSKFIEGIQISNDENTFFNAEMYGHNEFWSTSKQTTFYMAPYYTASGKFSELDNRWMNSLSTGLRSTDNSSFVKEGKKKKLSSATMELDICDDPKFSECKGIDILCIKYKEIKELNNKLNDGITELSILDMYFTESINTVKNDPNIETLTNALEYTEKISYNISSSGQIGEGKNKSYGLTKYFDKISATFKTVLDEHTRNSRKYSENTNCLQINNDFLFKISEIMCNFQKKFNDYINDINSKIQNLVESIDSMSELIISTNSVKKNKRIIKPKFLNEVNFIKSLNTSIKIDSVISECLSNLSSGSMGTSTIVESVSKKRGKSESEPVFSTEKPIQVKKKPLGSPKSVPLLQNQTIQEESIEVPMEESVEVPMEESVKVKKKRGRPTKTSGGGPIDKEKLTEFYNNSFKYNLVSHLKYYLDLIRSQESEYSSLINNDHLIIENIHDINSFVKALILMDSNISTYPTIIKEIESLNDESPLSEIIDINSTNKEVMNTIDNLNSVKNGIVYLLGQNSLFNETNLAYYFKQWNTNIYNLLNFTFQKFQNTNQLDEISDYNFKIIAILYFYLNKANIDYLSKTSDDNLDEKYTFLTFKAISLYFIKYCNILLSYIIKFDIPNLKSGEDIDQRLLYKINDIVEFIKSNDKSEGEVLSSYLLNILDTDIILSQNISDNFQSIIKNLKLKIDSDTNNEILVSVNGLLLLMFLYNFELKTEFMNYYIELKGKVEQLSFIKDLIDKTESLNTVNYVIFYNGYMKQLIFTDTVYVSENFEYLPNEDYIRYLIDTTIGYPIEFTISTQEERQEEIPEQTQEETQEEIPEQTQEEIPETKLFNDTFLNKMTSKFNENINTNLINNVNSRYRNPFQSRLVRHGGTIKYKKMNKFNKTKNKIKKINKLSLKKKANKKYKKTIRKQ